MHDGNGRGGDDGDRVEWREAEIPQSIYSELPDIENDAMRNWTALMTRFVADVRGEEHEIYQTFRDGWIYQQVIDAVRSAPGWMVFNEEGLAEPIQGLRPF